MSSAAAALVLLTGCAGTARIDITALNFRTIDPPDPIVTRLTANECYWWIDDDDRVWVAIRKHSSSLLGPIADFTFEMSLVFEKLPSGPARYYEAGKNELRALARFGPFQGRYVSVTGIVALYREKGDRLRGSLRFLAAREVSQLLGGFGQPTRQLFLGTFTAVHDDERGRAIVESTESAGFDRDTPWPQHEGLPPASQPATAP